jgi:hypothetical protein
MTIYHKHHIVPRHMGGTDDPSNLIELTIEEHAEAHRKLYEQYGRREDYLAWMGLSGWLSKEEMIKEKLSLGGKNGGVKLKGRAKSKEHKEALRNSLLGYKQKPEHVANVKLSLSGANSSLAQKYKFVDPTGKTYIVTGLNDFCRKHGLSQGNMCGVASGKRKQSKGWTCVKI